MSFDLKISNGDFVISSTGDLKTVIDNEKLNQDTLKVLSTPLNSNPFFPWYGCGISKSNIGNPNDFQFFSSFVTSQIHSSLTILQQLQSVQLSTGQKVTAGELLAAIKQVQVIENQTDSRYYRVTISELTKALNVINSNFDIGPI